MDYHDVCRQYRPPSVAGRCEAAVSYNGPSWTLVSYSRLSSHYSSCWHVNSSNTIAWCLFPLLRTRLAVTSNLLNGTRSRDRDAEAILGESDALPAVFAAGGRSKTRLALCGQPPPDGLYIHTLQHPIIPLITPYTTTSRSVMTSATPSPSPRKTRASSRSVPAKAESTPDPTLFDLQPIPTVAVMQASSMEPVAHRRALPEKRPRHKMTEHQLQRLEELYQANTHPSREEKDELAKKIGM